MIYIGSGDLYDCNVFALGCPSSTGTPSSLRSTIIVTAIVVVVVAILVVIFVVFRIKQEAKYSRPSSWSSQI